MLFFMVNTTILLSQEYSISGKTLNESGKKLATRIVLYDKDKRFIEEDNHITTEKLVFLKVISNVIASGMKIIGVSTPEEM
mgnify:CR=1 FL=1